MLFEQIKLTAAVVVSISTSAAEQSQPIFVVTAIDLLASGYQAAFRLAEKTCSCESQDCHLLIVNQRTHGAEVLTAFRVVLETLFDKDPRSSLIFFLCSKLSSRGEVGLGANAPQ